MRCQSKHMVFLVCFLSSSGSYAQCDSGAEVRIEVEKIEAKLIPSIIADSSSGARFVIDSKSNQIDIVISNASASSVRNFTSRYTKCIAIVSIKGISLQSESVANLFPLSDEAGFTKYLGLTIPKNDYHLEYLKKIVDGEKSIMLRIK